MRESQEITEVILNDSRAVEISFSTIKFYLIISIK